MAIITNEELTPILQSILDKTNTCRAYYIAGTLCIDLQYCVMVELTGNYHTFMQDHMYALSKENLKLAFDIYLKYKGDTDYYQEKLKKAQLYKMLNYETSIL
jgi:hypothetical protein